MSKRTNKDKILAVKTKIAELSPLTKIIIIVAAFLVVLGIILGIVLLVVGNMSQTTVQNEASLSKAERKVEQVKRDGVIMDSAQKALDQGDTNKADDIYKQAINGETDPAHKVELAVEQSKRLYISGKVNDAITVARQAESYSDDKFLVADWLSRVFEQQKDYRSSLDYYKLASKWSSSPTNAKMWTKSYYDDQVARMTSLAGQAK